MMENEQKLSYREILNMTKGYSTISKQQRMYQKYGPKPANTTNKDSLENTPKKESVTVNIDKLPDISDKEVQLEAQSDIVVEDSQANNSPQIEINPIREFEKIFRRYLH
jgi:hypothetical protein